MWLRQVQYQHSKYIWTGRYTSMNSLVDMGQCRQILDGVFQCPSSRIDCKHHQWPGLLRLQGHSCQNGHVASSEWTSAQDESIWSHPCKYTSDRCFWLWCLSTLEETKTHFHTEHNLYCVVRHCNCARLDLADNNWASMRPSGLSAEMCTTITCNLVVYTSITLPSCAC